MESTNNNTRELLFRAVTIEEQQSELGSGGHIVKQRSPLGERGVLFQIAPGIHVGGGQVDTQIYNYDHDHRQYQQTIIVTLIPKVVAW